MARIILGTYMFRYPLGGNVAWALQWIVGLSRLGHEVVIAEKSGWSSSCHDPVTNVMSDDCSYGIQSISSLLKQHYSRPLWCYVDAEGNYHGMPRDVVENAFKSSDLFIDMSHGEWFPEAMVVPTRVFLDTEPAFTQMKWEQRLKLGETLPNYDFYYSVGQNIGTNKSNAPTAGKVWRHVFNPVNLDLFSPQSVNVDAPFTTVMNWQAHESLEFNGVVYGQKNIEFEKYINLPRLTTRQLELAVSGPNVPTERLSKLGWSIRNAHLVSRSVDAYIRYIQDSAGEFGVCKNIFVATNCAWFSDRSAAYLAAGRPVVLQDTGFSEHLPCGQGLFAVRTAEEAAEAIEEIHRDYEHHSKWARRIASEHLDAPLVLEKLLSELMSC